LPLPAAERDQSRKVVFVQIFIAQILQNEAKLVRKAYKLTFKGKQARLHAATPKAVAFRNVWHTISFLEVDLKEKGLIHLAPNKNTRKENKSKIAFSVTKMAGEAVFR